MKKTKKKLKKEAKKIKKVHFKVKIGKGSCCICD